MFFLYSVSSIYWSTIVLSGNFIHNFCTKFFFSVFDWNLSSLLVVLQSTAVSEMFYFRIEWRYVISYLFILFNWFKLFPIKWLKYLDIVLNFRSYYSRFIGFEYMYFFYKRDIPCSLFLDWLFLVTPGIC